MGNVAVKDESLVADYNQAAAAFHQVSGFGRFSEPEPPYALPEPHEDTAVGLLKLGLVTDDSGLLKTMGARLSQRDFGSHALPNAYLGSLLWVAYGKRPWGAAPCNRVVPSAGATYPMTLYLLALSTEGLKPGFYRYQPASDTLVYLPNIAVPARPNDWFRTTHIDYGKAAGIIFIVGNWQRICPKYGARGYRYLLLEAGHMAQNICLLATALAVPHVPVGGFIDDAVNAAFGLDVNKEGAVYSLVLGQLPQRPC